VKKVDRYLALALFVLVSAVTLAAAPRQGVHRDEAVYMEAGERYITYWERVVRGQQKAPFSAGAVDPYFSCGAGCNSEHPPLMKLLFGLSWRLFGDVDSGYQQLHPGGFPKVQGGQKSLAWMPESTAFRLPTILIFGLLVAFVYLFFVEALAERSDTDNGIPSTAGRVGGLAAALLTAAQPRAFFHAQTAAFDLPAAFFWFACMAAYWRALGPDRPLRATIRLGILYGLFLATKLQSFFLPAALAAHYLWLRWRYHRARRRPDAPFGTPGPWPLVSMAVISPLVFFLLWPYLWHRTFAHFKTYWNFHVTHVHYNFEYLGVNYNHPPFPWHEPLGMLITTAPVVLLVLAAAGIGLLSGDAWRARKGPTLADKRSLRFLLLVCAVVPVLPFLTGQDPSSARPSTGWRPCPSWRCARATRCRRWRAA
jgi:hypothetical protein